VLHADVLRVVWFEAQPLRRDLHRMLWVRCCDTSLARGDVVLGAAAPAASPRTFFVGGTCPCRDYDEAGSPAPLDGPQHLLDRLADRVARELLDVSSGDHRGTVADARVVAVLATELGAGTRPPDRAPARSRAALPTPMRGASAGP